MKSLYKCERKFVLFDAIVSHGQLLLRADKLDGNDFNIDIIFFDTRYIELPTNIRGIEIFKLSNLEESYSSNANKFADESRRFFNIFVINSSEVNYHIVSSHFAVFKNKLSFGETSLGVLHYKGRDKEIFSSL